MSPVCFVSGQTTSIKDWLDEFDWFHEGHDYKSIRPGGKEWVSKKWTDLVDTPGRA